jgi:hypothetical protein
LKFSQNRNKDFGMVVAQMKDRFLLSALQVLQEINQQDLNKLKKSRQKIQRGYRLRNNKTSSQNSSRFNSDKFKRKNPTMNGTVSKAL